MYQKIFWRLKSVLNCKQETKSVLENYFFLNHVPQTVPGPLTLHCSFGYVLMFQKAPDGSSGQGDGGNLSTYLHLGISFPLQLFYMESFSLSLSQPSPPENPTYLSLPPLKQNKTKNTWLTVTSL